MPEWARGNHGDHIRGFETSGQVSRGMKDRGQVRGLRRDGAEFPAEASISVLKTGEHKIFTVILRDVSVWVKAEEEREFLLEQIHQAQKMDAVGTLAAGIAHDFNNLLVSILGYTDLGIDDLGPDHPVSANLMQVRKAGLRASGLVQQILSLSRDREQERKPVCLAEVVREALDLVRATLPSSIEVRDSIRKGMTKVLASETAIHQIVVNLCVNAGQAIGSEHGVVELRLEDIGVDDRLARRIKSQGSGDGTNGTGAGTGARQIMLWGDLPAGPYVRLCVRDTGCGMDRGTMSRIFEPFFTSRQVGEGTGLGLFAVHGIVTLHDGAIVVESTIDEGSEFQIYLPRHAGEAASGRLSGTEANGGTERVLFVDDEPDLVGLAKSVLGRLGYVVEGATSGEAALSKFRASPDEWDLVITDQAMPRLSGEALAREILAIRSNVPIILCSGYSDAIDEEQAKTIGFRGYVKKPAAGGELAAAVRRALDSA
jgi:signal transduction histidine kinase/ActR/RegA family two-component response regulator